MLINLIVTPGNNFIYKKFMEGQFFALILHKLTSQNELLRKFFEDSLSKTEVIRSPEKLMYFRQNIESIISTKNKLIFSGVEAKQFFEYLNESIEVLQQIMIFDEKKNCSYSVWSLLNDRSFYMNSFLKNFGNGKVAERINKKTSGSESIVFSEINSSRFKN